MQVNSIVATGMCLPSCCLVMNVYSYFAVPAFRGRVTVLSLAIKIVYFLKLYKVMVVCSLLFELECLAFN
jgi:hypothetical protein